MELRLWTAIGLLLVITVGAVIGVTVIGLFLPGGTGGSAPVADSGADARAPSVDAPAPGLLTRVFRYAVAFGFGGVVGLFLGIVVGQKAARSQSTEPISDRHENHGQPYGDGAERYADPAGTTDDSGGTTEYDPTDSTDQPWESNR